MLVFPEPATPWISSTLAFSLRMIWFCSFWMVEMMDFIFSSEVWASSCWRMSSWMFWELSKAYSISPFTILNWRFKVRRPSVWPWGAS